MQILIFLINNIPNGIYLNAKTLSSILCLNFRSLGQLYTINYILVCLNLHLYQTHDYVVQ